MADLMRLSAVGLACRRGGRGVFAGLSFTLRTGEALLVTGRNGAGKSSLLRLLAGLLQAESGRIELAFANAELSLAEQVHYVGHGDALKPSLSVAENLAFWRDFLGGAQSGGAPDAALAAFGIDALAALPASYLSAGQRRRLSLARLLCVHRPVWLLDEPTSALDDTAQTRLAGIMRAHLLAGGMIIAATHAPIGIDAKELRLGEAG